MITGFLSVKRKFDARSILKLWLQVFIASVVGQAVYCLVSGSMPGLKNLVKTFFPFTFNVYWYFSSYIVIYLLMPFINTMIDSIGQKKHKQIIGLSIILFSVIPTFTSTKWLTGINQIAMMIALYIVGSYCRKYSVSFGKKTLISCMVLSIIFLLVSEYVIRRFSSFDPFYFAWEMNKTPVVVFAVSLFLLVVNSNIYVTAMIKRVSKHAFGIYLIHIGWISPLLFEKVFANDKLYETPMMIVQIIGYLIAVLVVCVFIDYIYNILYNKIAAGIVDKVGKKMNEKLHT